MAGTGIWLSDQDLQQTGGALWAQQQTQQLHARVSAGQQWAQQQIDRLQQQAQAQVQAVAPQVAPPPISPVPTPPPPTPAPAPAPPAPMPAAAQAAIPSPPLQTIPPPAPPPATPPPVTTPPPPAPDTTTPAVPDLAPAGQDWAQQQIQNLLGSSATPPTPSPTPQPSTQGPQISPAAMSAPSAIPTPSAIPQATSATPQAQTSTPGAPVGPQPKTPGDLIDQARQAAIAAGIDPDIFARQIQQESGFNPTAQSGAGALGIAQFMPDTAKGLGIDPLNAAQSLIAAAKMDAQNLLKYGGDWAKTLAAYNAGPGNVDKYNGVPPFQETQNYVNTILGGAKDLVAQGVQAAQGAVQGALGGAQQAAQNVVQTGQTAVNTLAQGAQAVVARTSQFAMGLSSGDAMAFCGPAAAMAFAQTYGRNPTVDEAKQLAQQVGWNPSTGMAGAQSEVNLLNNLGVDAHMTSGVDWNTVAQDASGGNPVIIDTPGHYFYVDGYNAQTGQFHLGSSATDLKAAQGQEWFTPNQIPSLGMGDPRAAIYADHPLAQSDGVAQHTPVSNQATYMSTMQPATGQPGAGPSLIDQLLGRGSNAVQNVGGAFSSLGATAQNALGGAQDLLGQAGGTVQDKTQQVQDAVQNVGGAAQGALGAGQGLLSTAATDISQAPQTLNDLLTQNALVSAGVPVAAGQNAQNLPSYLQGLVSPAQDVLGSALNTALGVPQNLNDWLTQQQTAGQQYGYNVGQPLDLTKPLGPQLGVDPYGQIVQQGLPRMLGGIQQGNVGDILGGGLQTVLGAASALPGTGIGPAGAAAAAELAPEAGAQVTPDIIAAVQKAAPTATTQQILDEINVAAQRRIATDDLLRSINADATQRIAADDFLRDPANYDEYGVLKGFQPPNPVTYDQYGVRTDQIPPSFADLGPTTPALPASTTLEGLRQMAAQRGVTDTDILSQRLQNLTDQVNAAPDVLGGAQPGQINAAFARALGGAAAGGGGTYLATDPNDPNRWLKVGAGTLAGGLAAGPGLDLALAGAGAQPSGIGAGDWLRGIYRGGIVSSPATMLDVAGQSTLSPLISTITGLGRDALQLSPGRIQGRVIGTTAGLGDWANQFLGALQPSTIAAANPNALIGRAAPGLERAAAYAAEGAGAMHGAFQQATSNLIQSQELGALGGEIGWQQGLRGSGLQQFVQNFMNNPPPDALTAAQGVGARVSGGQQLGTLTSWLGRAATGGGPVSDALFPVYKKGMQLASRMVEMSPLGTAGTAIDVARGLIGQGPYAAGLGSTPVNNAVGPLAERLTNNAIGTGLAILLAHQADQGNITGSWQGLTPDQQNVLRGQGQSPNSVNLLGAWRDWSKLPPALQGPLIAAGAYADAGHAANVAAAQQLTSGPGAYGIQDPREAAAEELLREVGGQLMNRTPLRTFANTYDALTGGGGSVLGTPVDLASSVLGGLVPGSAIVRTAAQATDPLERQTLRPQIASQVLPAILQNLAQNIPGARETLPARLDVMGRDIQNPQQGLAAALPLHPAAGQPSPVLAAMAQAGVAPSAAPPSIPYGPAAKINLRPDEQQAYDRYRGQFLEQMAGPLVASPQFQQMSDIAQRASLQRIDTAAGQAAAGMMLRDLAPDAANRMSLTGVLAPVVSYGPGPLDQMTQMRNHAAQHALIQALISQSG